MSPDDVIGDDEYVLRHIPGGEAYQVPPEGRVSSYNFRLRKSRSETGFSVSRQSMTTPERLLELTGMKSPDSRIARVRVGDVRDLGFDVVSKPELNNPGHAEIIPSNATAIPKSKLRDLADLFEYVNITVATPPSQAAT